MDNDNTLNEIKTEILIMFNSLQKLNKSSLTDKWVPYSEVKEFLKYGNTQMATLEKSEVLIISKIGKRKFIDRNSFVKLLDNNIVPKNEKY